MRRFGLLALVLLLLLLLTATPSSAKDTVVIYTAIEPEQVTDYMKAVNKTLPNLEVKMLRLSTGDISARFMAEKDNMQADVIWGVAATNMMVFKNAGLLEPYAPKGLERVQSLFRDKAAAPAWVAPFSATAGASRSITARSTTTLQRRAWPTRQLVIVEARPAMATASVERFFRAMVH